MSLWLRALDALTKDLSSVPSTLSGQLKLLVSPMLSFASVSTHTIQRILTYSSDSYHMRMIFCSILFFQKMFRQWFIVAAILLSNLPFLFIQWLITVFTSFRVSNASVWHKDSYVTHMRHEHMHTGEPYIQQINKPLSISIQKRTCLPCACSKHDTSSWRGV